MPRPAGQPEPPGLLGRQPVPGVDGQHAGQGRSALSEQRASDGQRVGRRVRDVGQLPVELPGGAGLIGSDRSTAATGVRRRPRRSRSRRSGCRHRRQSWPSSPAPSTIPRRRSRSTACTAVPSRGPPRSRAGVRVSSRTSATTSSAATDSVTVRRPRRVSATTRGPPTARRQSFACRAALSAPQLPDRATTSMAPETLLRQNSRLSRPERSRALTTEPSCSVTLVPAVT